MSGYADDNLLNDGINGYDDDDGMEEVIDDELEVAEQYEHWGDEKKEE